MGPPVFSQIASVVEALLTNGVGVASRCLVLLIDMFSDVMPLEVVSSVKSHQFDDERSLRCLFSAFWPVKLLAQTSHTGVSPCFLGGGKGGGCGGSSTVASVGEAAESPSSTTGWCIFRCLCSTPFL